MLAEEHAKYATVTVTTIFFPVLTDDWHGGWECGNVEATLDNLWRTDKCTFVSLMKSCHIEIDLPDRNE